MFNRGFSLQLIQGKAAVSTKQTSWTVGQNSKPIHSSFSLFTIKIHPCISFSFVQTETDLKMYCHSLPVTCRYSYFPTLCAQKLDEACFPWQLFFCETVFVPSCLWNIPSSKTDGKPATPNKSQQNQFFISTQTKFNYLTSPSNLSEA